MVDYTQLMEILSKPRPNGSAAWLETRCALTNWIKEHQLPVRIHRFKLRPYFFPAIGVWLIFSRSLLTAAIWGRWGWPATIIALIGLAGGLVDVTLGFPLVTWPGTIGGENILIEFEPEDPKQEVILSAHYDSKTELLDHHQRMFFVRGLYPGIVLTVLLGILGPLDAAMLRAASPWAPITYWAGVALSLPLLFLAWGLGINLSMGALGKPSQGAVDNGAACAVLLGLANQIHSGENQLEKTRLTLALFDGEEVNMQGSRAFAQERQWPLPAVAVNLEILAQDGDYVYWEQDGTSLKLVPTAPQVNAALSKAVRQVTGAPAKPAGPVNSDGYSFLRVGIPATTLGTYDRRLKDRGFHGPADNLSRVVTKRLPEAVEILSVFLQLQDGKPFLANEK